MHAPDHSAPPSIPKYKFGCPRLAGRKNPVVTLLNRFVANSAAAGVRSVQPGASAAALAVIEEDGAGRAWDRRLEIGVLEYYVRRFAAQLQRHFLEIAGGSMDDQLADFGGSCEGNLVDVGMRGQRGPCGFAVARNNVHYAFREAGFHDQLAKTQRGERRLLCGFQHDCAARGQSWTKFPRRHEER